jgi:hypothetical protein
MKAAVDAPSVPSGDPLKLGEEDDGRLFVIRVLNTGQERVARYHYWELAGRELRFPCFADPDHPEDYLSWLHEGWGAWAVRRLKD